MHRFLVLSCLLAVAAAAAVEPIAIVRHDAAVEHDGTFHYSFESADGTKAEQHGELKVFDKDSAAVVSSGSVSYKGDDGRAYQLSYTADETGYHPQGDHLPVAPPVPEQILRALAYIAAHPQKDEPAKRF